MGRMVGPTMRGCGGRFALDGSCMGLVNAEILPIESSQFGAALDGKEVLGVVRLGGLREVEAACDDGFLIDDHDFVVSDGMLSIDEDFQPFLNASRHIGTQIDFVGLVEDELHFHATVMGINQSFDDRIKGK